ncbi:hypothetical protein L596_015102 [Steinernema carpocapsae]|uniref:Uncharacterized protein n=1 Tax=Steinernema carpocapsae TaxID=34508 RepID=A0A4U5NEI7_STECR|nr:hypothetical protein L596_015102 [Steinernema carpocapsae]
MKRVGNKVWRSFLFLKYRKLDLLAPFVGKLADGSLRETTQISSKNGFLLRPRRTSTGTWNSDDVASLRMEDSGLTWRG